MQNKVYTVDELIHDPSFRRMVNRHAKSNEIEKWDRWIEASDQNREKAKKAMAEISGFTFSEPDGIRFETEWNRLHQAINTQTEGNFKTKSRSISPLKWMYRAAAILVIVFCVGIGSYWYTNDGFLSDQTEHLANGRTLITGPQEQKTVKFSNGSKIVLRRNSSIEYGVDQLHKGTVEVLSLKGEAFFESGARPAASAFLVHTPDGVISDIGTQFLVYVEEQRSKVLLQQGRVQVQNHKGAVDTYNFEPKLGEMITFNRSEILSRKMVNTTFYTAWATGYLEFEETSVEQFAQFVQERFEVNVKVVDAALSGITLDGAIYFNSLEELVRSVSKVAKFPVSQSADDQTVYLGK